jgi:hypothetical protein
VRGWGWLTGGDPQLIFLAIHQNYGSGGIEE